MYILCLQTHDASELSTFNEYDALTDDDPVMSANGSVSSITHSPPMVTLGMTDLLNSTADDPMHLCLPQPLVGTKLYPGNAMMDMLEDDRDSAISARSTDSRGYRYLLIITITIIVSWLVIGYYTLGDSHASDL